MFCRLCGTKNPDDSKFCIKCGHELSATSEAEKVTETVKEFEVNSEPHADLLNSTTLMFKDIFRYGKCMSRAQYWLGTLGLVILTLAFLFVIKGLELGAQALVRAGQYQVAQGLEIFVLFAVVTAIITLILVNISATVRRLHDIGMDGAWILLQFIPVGNIIVLVFMCQPAVLENNRYRKERQSQFGQKLYQITGLVPAILVCLGLVGTVFIYGLATTTTVDDTESTELYYSSSDDDY